MAFGLAVSCETLELESLIENPNALNVSLADPNFLLNDMQLDFRNRSQGFSGLVDNLMRMEILGGTYNAVTLQGAMNGQWGATYNFNANVKILEAIAERDGLTTHLGMAQIMQATNYVNLVDYIGGAVFTEANDPTIEEPTVDDGELIYEAMYDLIDEGIANLRLDGPSVATDLYYQGNVDNWIRFANTFKIKMLLTTRLVNPAESQARINAILASGEYIQNDSQSLQFQYGSTAIVNESRHPLMSSSYINNASGYRPNNLISYMKDSSFCSRSKIDLLLLQTDAKGPFRHRASLCWIQFLRILLRR